MGITIHHGKLNIISPLQADDGNYYCNVSNSHGWVNYTIKVMSIKAGFNQEPIIKEKLSNHTVVVNSNVTLTCEPYSYDAANDLTIKWYRLELVNGSYDNVKQREIKTYMKTELVLPNVKMNDTGWYMCSLRNYFGTKRSYSFISVR